MVLQVMGVSLEACEHPNRNKTSSSHFDPSTDFILKHYLFCSILKVTRNCAFSFKSLLEHIQQLITEPTDEKKEQLPRLAEVVTDSIQELWEAAKELRGVT